MLESLGPEVACGDAEVLWALALVLEFLLDREGRVHGRRLERLGERVQLDVHLLDVDSSLRGRRLRLLLFD